MVGFTDGTKTTIITGGVFTVTPIGTWIHYILTHQSLKYDGRFRSGRDNKPFKGRGIASRMFKVIQYVSYKINRKLELYLECLKDEGITSNWKKLFVRLGFRKVLQSTILTCLQGFERTPGNNDYMTLKARKCVIESLLTWEKSGSNFHQVIFSLKPSKDINKYNP